jgi:hypothetical protein
MFRYAQIATGRIRRGGHDKSFRIYKMTSSTDHGHDHQSLASGSRVWPLLALHSLLAPFSTLPG